MAILTNGIMGGFSGTVGTVVGSNWRGKDYIRARAVYRKSRPFSPKQVDHQLKFKLVSRFTHSLQSLLLITYGHHAVQQTARNSAVAYLLQEAVTGSSPHFELDYSKVLISRGTLLGAKDASVRAGLDAAIDFRWRANAGAGGARDDDRAILVAYCPTLQKSCYAITTATRNSGIASLIAEELSGHTVHAWLAFISEDGQRIANIVYAGALVVD